MHPRLQTSRANSRAEALPASTPEQHSPKLELSITAFWSWLLALSVDYVPAIGKAGSLAGCILSFTYRLFKMYSASRLLALAPIRDSALLPFAVELAVQRSRRAAF
jgi:hypothetical protein